MGKVLVRGRLIPDEDYIKGPTLVHTEEGWRQRSMDDWILERRFLLWFITVIYLSITLPLLVFAIVMSASIMDILMIVALTALLFYGVLAFIVVLEGRRRGKDVTYCLHRRGFQLGNIFLPYEEVGTVKRRDMFPLMRRGNNLHISLKHPLSARTSLKMEPYFIVHEDLLGEEAMQTLRMLMADEHSIKIE